MRFRGKLVNSSLFFRMAQSVDKLSKRCIIKFDPHTTQFIVANLSGDSNVQVWGHIEMNVLFEDLKIESLNENQIWLEVFSDTLCKALKSTQTAAETTCKLTKKDGLATLSFTIVLTHKVAGQRMSLTQDVAVRVLTGPQAEEYREPLVPEPQVHIMMPSLVNLRPVVDRLKSLQTQSTVAGNMSGQLRLLVESDALQLETVYSGLVNPSLDPSQISQQHAGSNRDPTQFAKVVVDVKDLAKFVGSHIVNPSRVVCCIIENHALVFYVYVGSGSPGEDSGDQTYGSLTYYVRKCSCCSARRWIKSALTAPRKDELSRHAEMKELWRLSL